MSLPEYSRRREIELSLAASSIRTHITRQNPDFVVFGGRSATVSQAIVQGDRSSLRTGRVLVFPDDLNQSLYSSYGSLRTEKDVQDYLQQHFPQLTPDRSIMFVDDFADTGEKARRIPATFNVLGYQNANLAVVVANPDTSPEDLEKVFVASRDRDLFVYIRWIAGMISHHEWLATYDNPGKRQAEDFTKRTLSELRRMSR